MTQIRKKYIKSQINLEKLDRFTTEKLDRFIMEKLDQLDI